eukprot:COSAG01_NODE_27534_length_683_cov_1.188356_1_plen_157_part_00
MWTAEGCIPEPLSAEEQEEQRAYEHIWQEKRRRDQERGRQENLQSAKQRAKEQDRLRKDQERRRHRRVEEKIGFLKFQKNRYWQSHDITPNVRVSPFCGAHDREMYVLNRITREGARRREGKGTDGGEVGNTAWPGEWSTVIPAPRHTYQCRYRKT